MRRRPNGTGTRCSRYLRRRSDIANSDADFSGRGSMLFDIEGRARLSSDAAETARAPGSRRRFRAESASGAAAVRRRRFKCPSVSPSQTAATTRPPGADLVRPNPPRGDSWRYEQRNDAQTQRGESDERHPHENSHVTLEPPQKRAEISIEISLRKGRVKVRGREFHTGFMVV
jgi:hypothetical protein